MDIYVGFPLFPWPCSGPSTFSNLESPLVKHRFNFLLILKNTAEQPSHRLEQQGYVVVQT